MSESPRNLSFVGLLMMLIPFSARGEMKKVPWFKGPDCSELSILYFPSQSDEKAMAMLQIKEPGIVQSVADRIRSLPDGDEKISWGKAASRMTLEFLCGQDWERIDIIGGRIKTPSTGFISEKTPKEAELVDDLLAMAVPQVNRPLPMLPKFSFRFKDFTIAYDRTEHTPQPPGGPTIGPTSRSFYEIVALGTGNTVTISIFSGQIPPQPQSFAIGKKVYYLLTFGDEKGKRLRPGTFVVSDRTPSKR